MKKLIIGAAIAIASTFAHAANFNWSASGLTGDNGSADGLFAFAFFSETSVEDAWAMVSTAFPGAYAEQGFAGVIEGGATSIGPVNDPEKISGTATGYILLVNATPADIETWAPTKYSVVQGGPAGTQSIAQPNGNYTFTFGAAQQGEWQSVPEPTSGLLLLLGVTGLALRRRRA